MSEPEETGYGKGKIEVSESNHIPPCPHCQAPITRILKNRSSGAVQIDVIYSCAACGGLLSIGYDNYR